MIPYELEIAWAHLSSRKGQTAIIVFGIAFAVTVMSFLANLNEGQLRDVLDRAVEDNSPHVILEPVEDTFPRTRALLAGGPAEFLLDNRTLPRRRILHDPQAVVDRALRRSEVKAAAPYVAGDGFVLRGDREFAVAIRGIVPGDEAKIVKLARQMGQGRLEDLRADGIIIGRRLYERLRMALGDRLLVVTPLARRDLRVVGVFDSGVAERDLGQTFVALRTGQHLFGLGLGVSGVALKLHSLHRADAVARALGAEAALKVRSWTDDNGTLVKDIATTEGVFFVGNLFVSLMAFTSVAAVLLMLVLQKTREIGILLAMGARARSLAAVFCVEALALGAAGSVLGTLGAYLLLVYFQTHSLGGTVQRVAFEPWLFWRAILFTVTACVLACLWPARCAARTDPVRAIRAHG